MSDTKSHVPASAYQAVSNLAEGHETCVCGKMMVKRIDTLQILGATSFNQIWWCGCGYTASARNRYEKTQEELRHDAWKQANEPPHAP